MNVETSVRPPDTDDGDGCDHRSVRVAADIMDADNTSYDASVHIFEVTGPADPDEVADSLIRVIRAVAQLHSSAVSWALEQRLTAPTPGGAS